MWQLRREQITGRGALDTSAAVAYQGPGDVVSGATAWISSARAYTAAFAAGGTAIMDLLDQAGANPITINILSTGFVDVSAITTWVAAHSVSTIKITKLYDQTGNGNHFTQGTLATMPTLTLSAINGLPGITSASASNTVISSPSVTIAQPFTMVSAAKRTSGTTNSGIMANGAGAAVTFGFGGANTARMIAGVGAQTAAATDNSFYALQAVFNGASSSLIVDGSATAATGVGTTAFSSAAIRACRSHDGNTLDGIIMETGIWPSAFNSTQYGNVNTNLHSTNGYNY